MGKNHRNENSKWNDANYVEKIISNAIVNANNKIKKEEESKDIDGWQKAMQSKTIFGKIFKIMFVKQKEIETEHANKFLIQFVLNAIYCILKWTLYTFSILVFIFGFYYLWYVYPTISISHFIVFLAALFASFLIFFFGRVVRIAQFEIDSIKSIELLLAILGINIAMLALIISSVSLIISKG